MLDLQLETDSLLHRLVTKKSMDLSMQAESPSEKVKLLIVRDLLRLGWEMSFKPNRVLIEPPTSYNKQTIKESMQIKRVETFAKYHKWIKTHLHLAHENLIDGKSAWDSSIGPVIEICRTQKQFDIFRIFRFYWSSPYSEYVGRRIKLIIRDNALPSKPVIGIAALGSSIIHIPDRDEWVGWSTKVRTANLVFAMDAYVIGALPPYNHLLGGKLISYIMASNEVREIYMSKYADQVTNISRRTANDLACIFTTSLYGKSSQYNRIKYNGNLLFVPIGHTKGYGTLHLTDETFAAMRNLLNAHNISVTNKFGDGPIWRMRVIRTAAEILNFDADFLLRHSFKRQIYALPLANNFREYLQGEADNLDYQDYPLTGLVAHWKDRWLAKRKMNLEVKEKVLGFKVEDFSILQL